HFTASDYYKMATMDYSSVTALAIVENDFVFDKIVFSVKNYPDVTQSPCFLFFKKLIYHKNYLLIFEQARLARINPHLSGDFWYQIALMNIVVYLPYVLKISDIREKLTPGQLFDLIIRNTCDLVDGNVLEQPGVVEKLMPELSSAQKNQLLRNYQVS